MSRYASRYAEPNGPGDQRPTAMEVLEDEDMVGKLTGKVIMITGVSSGLGIDTLRVLHRSGATIYGTVRDVPKGQKVVDEILAEDASNTAKIHLVEVDLASFDSIRKGVKDFLSKEKQLNILINNAGVMACPEGRTKDGWETQFGSNHLGHFLLFELLKPTLLASASPEFPSRVVSLSSTGHRRSSIKFENINLEGEYEPMLAYGQAKTANIWFANEIERRYGDKNLHATSLHPGIIETPLARHLEGQLDALKAPEIAKTFKSVGQGSATTVYAAISKEWSSKGGKYLSDCQEQPPFPKDASWLEILKGDGHMSWAYDPDGEKKLWNFSLDAVGLSDELVSA